MILLEEWEKAEMKVFSALIDFGVEYVMIGHLLFPQVNNEIASLSSYWIKDVLKNKLNFMGKTISDDICMQALTDRMETNSELIFKKAGLDFLIIKNQEHPLLKIL